MTWTKQGIGAILLIVLFLYLIWTAPVQPTLNTDQGPVRACELMDREKARLIAENMERQLRT